MNPDAIRLFCSEYIQNGLNGASAYKALHPKASAKTASVEACRVLANPSVQEALQPMIREALAKAKVDREWIIRRLVEQSNASPLDYFKVNEDGSLGELELSDLTPAQRRNLKTIRITRTKWGESITVAVCDQQRALSVLAKVIGLVPGRIREEAREKVGDLIERGVNAIRKHKDLDAWKEVLGDVESTTGQQRR
jgi:hypothetical protein